MSTWAGTGVSSLRVTASFSEQDRAEMLSYPSMKLILHSKTLSRRMSMRDGREEVCAVLDLV